MSYHASLRFRDWSLGALRVTWHRYLCLYDDRRHWAVALDWVTPQRTTPLAGWTAPRCEHQR